MFRTSIVHLQESSYAVCCNLVCLDTSCCYEGEGRNPDFIFLHCILLPFIFMCTYRGVSFRSLQVLLYQMAAMHLYSSILMFSYVCTFFVCWAFINLILYGPCSSFTLITTGRIETYQIATHSIRTFLKMGYWSPKHVELLNVMNKINHQILCILLDYRYI